MDGQPGVGGRGFLAVRADTRWSCGASLLRTKPAGRGSAGPPEVLVLDAGAFVAVERGDRDVVALIKRERLAGRVPVSHGGVVAQVARGNQTAGAGGPAAGRGGHRCTG